jgi:hypothetical protein
MSCEEHLVENVMTFIEENGWNYFKKEIITVEDIKKKKLESFAKNGTTEVSLETLAWLFTLAVYVEYQRSLFEE